MKMRVGFIGMGNMGFPMAQNILKAGFPLTIYNRTKERGAGLIELGSKWADSPAQLAEQCDIIVTMIANDDALKEIVEGSAGIFHSAKKPSIHIS